MIGKNGDYYKRLEQSILKGEPLPMIVVAADIRKSTFLMREAVDFVTFASILSGFIDDARRQFRTRQRLVR